jgi:transcriptional regulator with XRE-family HTH domain
MVDDQLGNRIRAARRARGMSLADLAAKVGVSASMLSLLETGRSQSSVATLYAVVEALGMSMNDLFADRKATASVTTGDSPERVALIRAAELPRIELETGVIWEQIGEKQADGLEVLMVTYPPGQTSSMSGRFQQHTGFELAHVLQGELHGRVRFEEFTLVAGDSVSFDSGHPHVFENHGEVEARAMWVVLRPPARDADGREREPDEALGARSRPAPKTDR